MAEEKKSIEISYKADINDLKQKLAQIPNITGEEAKKMVAALDRQLKQAESASKKSAEATKKAAQEAGKSAANAAREFDHMSDAAKRSEERLDMVAEKSGDIDRGFSSVGLALRGVNPQLAEAADGLADMFAVGEGVLLTFKSLNPAVLAVTVALGALTLGYTAYQAQVEAANQAIIAQKEAMKGLNNALLDQRNNFYAANDAINGMRDQLALARGEITKYEYDRKKATLDTGAQFDTYISKQEEIIAQRKEEQKLVQSIRNGNVLLSEDEKNRLKNLQLLVPGISLTQDLLDGSAQSSGELYKIEQAISANIQQQNLGLDRLKTQKDEAVTIAKQLVDIAESERIEKEAQAKVEKKITKEKVDQKDLEAERLKAIEDSLKADAEQQSIRESHLAELRKIIDDNILSEDQKKEAAYQKELERIDELARMTGDIGLANMALWAMEHKKKMDDLEAEQQKKKAMFEEDLANGSALADQVAGLASTYSELAAQKMQVIKVDAEEQKKKQEEFAKMTDLEREAYNQRKKIAMRAFRFEQAASLAQIAFNTAEAITKALAYPPILRGAMIATIGATGMAQAAVVSGRQPPSMHTGGMAPDEMGARVLKGEAVLDRATVRAIGGEQGVKDLQQGNMQANTIVIQPFKHFGRFAREIGFQPPKKTGIKV
jgi:hypothetical protein